MKVDSLLSFMLNFLGSFSAKYRYIGKTDALSAQYHGGNEFSPESPIWVKNSGKILPLLIFGFLLVTQSLAFAQDRVVSITAEPYQGGNSAVFTLATTAHFTSATSTERLVNIRISDSSDFFGTVRLSTPTIHFFAQNSPTSIEVEPLLRSAEVNSMKVEILPRYPNIHDHNRYTVDPDKSTATVYRITPTTPGISITVRDNKSEIVEGDGVGFKVSLTSAPGHTARHTVTVSWSVRGLVTSVGHTSSEVVDVSNRTSVPVFISIAATNTEQTTFDFRKLNITTDPTVLQGSIGTISASLDVTEDPVDPPSADPPGAKESPVYDPIYHPETSSVSVIVNPSSVDINWSSAPNHIISSANSAISYDSYSGTYTVSKVPSVTVSTSIEEVVNGTKASPPSYASWTFSSGNISFNPINSIINTMSKGDYVTSTLKIEFKRGMDLVNTQTVSVSIWRPNYTFAFDSGQTGTIASTNAGTYSDVTGTGTFDLKQEYNLLGDLEDQNIEVKVDEAFTGLATKTRSVQHKASERADTHTEGGKDYIPVGSDLVFGIWYFTPGENKYIFRPAASAIDALDSGVSVTSTLTVEFQDYDAIATAVVTMTGNGPSSTTPVISISTVNEDDEVVEGSSAWFKVASTIAAPVGDMDIRITVDDPSGYLSSTAPESVTIKAGAMEAYLELPTKTLTADPTANRITVTLENGIGYGVSSTAGNSYVDVQDIGPTITPSRTSDSPITEGGTITYQVARSGSTVGDLTVHIGFADGVVSTVPGLDPIFHKVSSLPDYLPNSVVIPDGEPMASLQIKTVDDLVDETASSTVYFVVYRPEHAKYENVGGAFTSTVITTNITDNDDPPAVSVSAVKSSIIEGETAVFRVVTPVAVAIDQRVPITVTNTGSYAEGTLPMNVTIKANTSEALLEIPTKTNSDDPNGVITVTPTNGTAASITILDAGPVAELVKQGQTLVQEGSEVSVGITLKEAWDEDVLIPIELDTSDENRLVEPPEIVRVPAGQTSWQFKLQVFDDKVRNTTDRFNILAYRLSTSNFEISNNHFSTDPQLGRVSEIQHSINDDEAEPKISVEAVSRNILEGDAARFKIISNRAYAGDLSINLLVTRRGDVVHRHAGLSFDMDNFAMDNTAADNVTLAANATQLIYEIPTKPENSDTTGWVSLEVQDSTGYTVDTSIVNLKSDNQDTILVADAGPVVTITNDSGTPVEEGSTVQVTLTATPPPPANSPITIPIAYTRNPELTETNPPREVRLDNSNPSMTLMLPLADNGHYNGIKILQILFNRPEGGNFEWSESMGFQIGSSGAVPLTIGVTDNDSPPTLSISADDTNVPEGGTIRFVVTRSALVPLTDDAQVDIELQDVGGFIGGSGVKFLNFTEGSTTATLELPTTMDGRSGGDGLVVARLALDRSFYVSAFPDNTATVTVGGAGSVVSISAPQTVTEGNTIEFTLTASQAPSTDTVIPVAVSDGMRSTFAKMAILGHGDPLGSTIPASVTISASTGMGTLSIPTTENNLDDLNGRGVVRVEFQPSVDSGLDFGSNRNYDVAVLDSDPTPKISISPPSGNVLEGDSAIFTLSATQASSMSIIVKFTLTDSASKVSGSVPLYVIVPAGQTMAEIELLTTSDGTASTNATVTVTLAGGLGYTVDTNAMSAEATIANPGPVVTLATASTSVAEGSSVAFTVSRPMATDSALTVQYFVSDGVATTFPDMTVRGSGNLFTAIPSGEVTIPANSASEEFSIQLMNDGVHGTSAKFHVVLHRPANALYELASNEPLVVTVTDLQTEPEISIAASDTVTEGDPISFAVSTTVGSIRDLYIDVTVTESAEDTIAGAKPSNVLLPAGETQVMLVVQTQTDGTASTNATVTVTLVDGSGYSLSSTEDTKVVTLTDSGAIVSIAVDPAGGIVTEGGSVTYTLSILSAVSEDIIIPISYSDGTMSTFTDGRILGTGDVLGTGLPSEVRIMNGSTSNTVTVSMAQDDYDEDIGFAFVNFHRQQGAKFEFKFSVADTIADAILQPGEVNDHRQQITVNDDPNDSPPTLSVAAVYDEIFEGDSARFRFISEGQSSEDFPVNVMLAQTSGFLSERNTEVVTFKGRTSETIVELMTEAGGLDDFEGSITLSILAADKKGIDQTPFYTVANTPTDAGMAVVKVSDNDISVVTISVDRNTINEGEFAEFTVTRSIRSSFVLAVKVTVDQDTHDFIQGNPDTTAFIPPDRSFITYSVATNDDTSDERPGSIMVDIVAGAGYTVGESSNSSVTVVDNDAPEISVSAVEMEVEEGNPARFTFTSVSIVDATVRVRVSTEQSGDFILWRAESTVEIVADSDNQTVEIQTQDDDQMEDDGSISIILLESTTDEYQLSGTVDDRSATVVVQDNDESGGSTPGTNFSIAGATLAAILSQSSDNMNTELSSLPTAGMPTISVVAQVAVVEEGDVAVFAISVTGEAKTTLRIEYALELVGEFTDRVPTGPAVLEVGRQTAIVKVPTVDDDRAEPDGAITLILAEGDGYKVANPPDNMSTVAVSDAADRRVRTDAISSATAAVLDGLTWTTGSDWFGAVTARNEGSGRDGKTSIALMGQSSLRDAISFGGEEMNDDGIDWRTALDNSSFNIALHPEGGSEVTAAVWGVGDSRNLNETGFETGQSWRGDHTSGHFGFDAKMGEHGLVGLAASFSSSKVNYSNGDDVDLEFTSVTQGIQPYLGWMSSDGNSNLLVTASHGPGTVRIGEADYATEKAETEFNMVGVNVGRKIPIWNGGGAPNGGGLNLTGQAWFSQQRVRANNSYIQSMQLETGQFRIVSEVTRRWKTEGSEILIPSVKFGVRENRRQARSFGGMEIETGLNYSNPFGLKISGVGRLLAVDMDRILNRRFEGQLTYDQNNDGLGLGIELNPTWTGKMEPASNYMPMESPMLVNANTENPNDQFRLESKFSYGFKSADWNWEPTPYVGMELGSKIQNEIELGSRIREDGSFKLDISGSKKLNTFGVLPQKFELRGGLSW